MAVISTRVGGKEVLASGILVLGPRDPDATITIDNLNFTFAFTPTEEPARLFFDIVDQLHLRVTIAGKMDALTGPATWDLQQIAKYEGQQLHLTLHVAETRASETTRTISYTFSTSVAV